MNRVKNQTRNKIKKIIEEMLIQTLKARDWAINEHLRV